MSTAQLDTSYTQEVKNLILAFYDPKQRTPSVIGDATSFFASYAANSKIREQIVNKISKGEDASASSSIIDKLVKHDKLVLQQRHERNERLKSFIDRLLSLTEGTNESETITATSKFLGTLFLITDRKNIGFAKQHKILKPLFKAALALRLTDAVLAFGDVQHEYLSRYIDSQLRFKGNENWSKRWRSELAFPIVKAALLQDVGLYHPSSLELLFGKNQNLDEFRLLDDLERKRLLKLNFQYSLSYLSKGLGTSVIKANSKQEKEKLEFGLSKSLAFAIEIVQDATVLKNHIGDLIKISQIYASFVLSTKSNYNMKDVPKGYMVIEQLMKNSALDKRTASCFLKLVGYFPQGFGVSYIANDDQGNSKNTYELGIVNRLYPSSPSEPNVRSVTRNLTYIVSGKELSVKREDNLYFQSNHKKIQRIDSERLNDILSKLSGGKTGITSTDLIPKFWEPFDFFATKTNQNIWTKT